MFSEEDAVKVLQTNKLNPEIHQYGNRKTIVAKLHDGYSLTVRQDSANPESLCAYFKRSANVLVSWNKVNQESLVLAIRHIKEIVGLTTKPNKWLLALGIAVFLSSLGGASFIISARLTSCKNQSYLELPLQRFE